MNAHETAGNITTTINGTVSGQVAIGNNNRLEQTISTPAMPVTLDELVLLRKEFSDLQQRLEVEAPLGLKDSAQERLAEMENAILDPEPDHKTLNKLEYVRDWFLENLPGLAGAVGSLVLHPIVGRLVEAGGDLLVSEFKHRFHA